MVDKGIETFIDEIKQIIDDSRSKAMRSVDFCRVQMYWAIGKRISEREQQGKERADYGKYIIRNLSKEIEPLYGSGFGVRQLELSRQFYRTYPNANTLCSQLNWSQYKLLIAIPDPEKREYYQLEAVNECWSKRQLERQINSMLYERLLLSNDKEAVLAVARNERVPESPKKGGSADRVTPISCWKAWRDVSPKSAPDNPALTLKSHPWRHPGRSPEA